MQEQRDIRHFQELLRQQLPLLADRYSVKTLELFGSYVREEQVEESDLDVLVEFQETPGLLKFVELGNFLSDLLDVEVDLVMKDALKPRIGQRILKEAMPI